MNNYLEIIPEDIINIIIIKLEEISINFIKCLYDKIKLSNYNYKEVKLWINLLRVRVPKLSNFINSELINIVKVNELSRLYRDSYHTLFKKEILSYIINIGNSNKYNRYINFIYENHTYLTNTESSYIVLYIIYNDFPYIFNLIKNYDILQYGYYNIIKNDEVKPKIEKYKKELDTDISGEFLVNNIVLTCDLYHDDTSPVIAILICNNIQFWKSKIYQGFTLINLDNLLYYYHNFMNNNNIRILQDSNLKEICLNTIFNGLEILEVIKYLINEIDRNLFKYDLCIMKDFILYPFKNMIDNDNIIILKEICNNHKYHVQCSYSLVSFIFKKLYPNWDDY
jgi:hypothetical protein